MDALDRLRLAAAVVFAVFLLTGAGCAFAIRFLWPRGARLRMAAMRALVFVVATITTLFAIEFVFAFCVVQSDGFGGTLAAELWFARYWHPINGYGYRDTSIKHFEGRSVLLVVGDSFVAGHGIRRIEDRFADRLAKLLGDKWEFAVIGDNGWDTSMEMDGLRRYPVKPNLVVLSYYINDIQGPAERNGFPLPRYFRPPTGILAPLVEQSFFVNWAYWRLYRHGMGDDYWDYLTSAFSNPTIWKAHAGELESFANAVAEQGARLCVVVWPELDRIRQSRAFTDRVVDVFRRSGALVVDLAVAFDGRSADDLIVNALDVHPNRRIHGEVAVLIADELLRSGYARPSRP